MATRTGTEGFTLLEIMIAVAIMVVAFTAILSVQQGSLRATERAKILNTVAMLAKAEMTATEVKMEGKEFSDLKDEEEGSFPEPYIDYRWKREIKEVEFPGFSTGNTDEDSGAGGEFANMLGQLVSNFLSKAVREVTVTIIWKRGAGDQSYSLTTYWVDMNHELALTP